MSEKCLAFARRLEELAKESGVELHDFADGPPKGDEWLSISFREKPQEQRNL